MTRNQVKGSYTITCSSFFRDEVLALAEKKEVNAGDLARSIILSLPKETIEKFSDAGEPEAKDREKIVLKTGPSKNRPWARKPRLQVRLPKGYDAVFIRKALNLALALDKGDFSFKLENKKSGEERLKHEIKSEKEKNALISLAKFKSIEDELEKLKTIISVLMFEPLKNGVSSKEEALYVFGFAPFSYPSKRMIVNRFRMLATIHHPDSELGSHERMSQLNAAMDTFRKSSNFY